MIKFVDLSALHDELGDELVGVLRTALASGVFVGDAMVEQFEEEFAAYCGVEHCVGVGSGTDALRLALIAAGIGPGDEVVMPANGFVATAEAVIQSGASVRFCDIDRSTGLAGPQQIEAAVTPKTGALIVVHLYGQVCDMAGIGELARRHGLLVLEDAAQAHGAEYRGRRAGGLSEAGCFSFYPSKNLGALGEGGAVVTRSIELADRVRRLRNHGERERYVHDELGWNGRLDAIQAGFLSVKLRRLDEWNASRRRLASLYRDLLSDRLLKEVDGGCGVYHLLVAQHDDRDGLRAHLAGREIESGVHYPIPLHLQPALAHLGFRSGDFPGSEAMCGRILSLPMHPNLTPDSVREVAEAVLSFDAVEVA